MGRGGAHPLRAEAGAGTIGHRLVERDAGDGDVHAIEVAGILPAHEGERAGVCRLDGRALMIAAPKGGIAGRGIACVVHCRSAPASPVTPAKAGVQWSVSTLSSGCQLALA